MGSIQFNGKLDFMPCLLANGKEKRANLALVLEFSLFEAERRGGFWVVALYLAACIILINNNNYILLV